jgi:polyhydroxybutyrate depolymerase
MACNSFDNQQQVDPGCIIHDDCTVPTIWCSHNDPDYGGTEHGVPCFALQSMYDFFASL